MKNALEWIKSNPISVAAAVVALFGFLLFGFYFVFKAPAYRAEKSDVLQKPLQSQKQLIGVPVPLPNEDPNAEPDIESVVVNQRVIDDVRTVYSEIEDQANTILELTSNKNADRHRAVMLGRGAIWPDAEPTESFGLFVQAKDDYLLHYKALFTPQNEGWNMPSMWASSPPRSSEIQLELARTAFNFINSIGVSSPNELTQDQANLLYSEQRTVLMSLLTKRARSINIYAQLPPDQDPFAPEQETDPEAEPGTGLGGPEGGDFISGTTQNNQQDTIRYPFMIAPWARLPDPPRPDQLWEGQVELWIVRDIMQAIHDLNKVGGTQTVISESGEERQEPSSVINSPIKRLLELRPLPGYVGLHSTGGVLLSSKLVTKGSNSNETLGFNPKGEDRNINFDSGTASATQGQSAYPSPPTSLAPLDPTQKAPEHFGITPTGRVSNSVFDVRHTRLIIDIEWDSLEAFFEQLRETNFMTVIAANLKDIDEYQVLREGGYVYGDKDVVRAELIIESLWFRNWTTDYMPKSVKQKLLILPPDNAANPYADTSSDEFQ